VATVTAPAGSGRARLVASRAGMVRSFGQEISIR
jgi:hypothetical protein